MNEVLACLLTRRSIRNFDKDKKISLQELDIILKAGMYAPSAMNRQPWEFIVVNQEEICKKLVKIHPYASYLKDSGCAVIVCGDREKSLMDCWIQDCSACSQNILLATHSLGLGAVWCGIYPNEQVCSAIVEMFNLPNNIIPLSLIVLGYPTKQPEQPNDRFDEKKIHYNEW